MDLKFLILAALVVVSVLTIALPYHLTAKKSAKIQIRLAKIGDSTTSDER